ncbi:MAG: helix-turn-helix domain-containing protein, partial [Proteobacteria bacterium]|nr:helix-turn-helix domain-containing protein [Pseudomonadota bacterium]
MSGLSSFIKQRRHELGLTQKEFAERFRLSLRVLRSIEQGHSNVLLSSVIDIMTA